MAEKSIKKYSVLILIWEKQTKTTALLSAKMTEFSKKIDTKDKDLSTGVEIGVTPGQLFKVNRSLL